MKKLLMSLSFIAVLFANDCSIYLKKGMKMMKESNNAIIAEIGVWYELKARNYFELYKICKSKK